MSLSQQAFNILTSSALVDALDISKEPEAVRERYGKGDPNRFGDGAPRNLEHFLMARRLVEAGCRVVTLNFGRWDFHSDNFNFGYEMYKYYSRYSDLTQLVKLEAKGYKNFKK